MRAALNTDADSPPNLPVRLHSPSCSLHGGGTPITKSNTCSSDLPAAKPAPQHGATMPRLDQMAHPAQSEAPQHRRPNAVFAPIHGVPQSARVRKQVLKFARDLRRRRCVAHSNLMGADTICRLGIWVPDALAAAHVGGWKWDGLEDQGNLMSPSMHDGPSVSSWTAA